MALSGACNRDCAGKNSRGMYNQLTGILGEMSPRSSVMLKLYNGCG